MFIIHPGPSSCIPFLILILHPILHPTTLTFIVQPNIPQCIHIHPHIHTPTHSYIHTSTHSYIHTPIYSYNHPQIPNPY